MKKSIRPIVSVLALVILIGAIFFAGKPQPTAGQGGGFESYQLRVHCGNPQAPTEIFWHDVHGVNTMGVHTRCAGNCPGGKFPLADALAGLPVEVSAALKVKVEKHQENAAAGKGRSLTCLRDGKEPPPDDQTPPEKKCEKPTPWFDPPPKCLLASPQIAVNRRAVTLSICASPVFRYIPEDKDPLLLEAYIAALRGWVQQRIGSKICCKQFRAAERSGTPCNPVADLDCDGIPNQTDVVSQSGASFPDINNLFSSPAGAPIDPFPFGLDPDDPNFLPPPEKCDCKWELVKGTLNCSPDKKQRHFYQARWRCPSTGNERFTRKYASPTTPCP